MPGPKASFILDYPTTASPQWPKRINFQDPGNTHGHFKIPMLDKKAAGSELSGVQTYRQGSWLWLAVCPSIQLSDCSAHASLDRFDKVQPRSPSSIPPQLSHWERIKTAGLLDKKERGQAGWKSLHRRGQASSDSTAQAESLGPASPLCPRWVAGNRPQGVCPVLCQVSLGCRSGRDIF